MEGDDMMVCHKCGGLLMVDGVAKVKADLARSMGLEVVSPVCTYSCRSCGISFTEHESEDTLAVPKSDFDEPEYGSNLTELIFDR